MSRHADFERLQDYREGLLSPEEEELVRVHLEECVDCRRAFEALGTLMDSVGELPLEAQPSRDLWPQIEWRMGAGEGGTGSVPGENAEGPRARITLAAWQLLAASVALALLSGGTVWTVLSGGSRGPAQSVTALAPESFVAPVGWGTALDGYDEAVTDLEEIFEAGRDVLDPETIRVLEETLQTIDRAIQESQEALAQDPGSKFLGRLLTENMRRKVELLRRAANAVYANT